MKKLIILFIAVLGLANLLVAQGQQLLINDQAKTILIPGSTIKGDVQSQPTNKALQPPVYINWYFFPDPVCPNENVHFNSYNTSDTYFWTFGDGATSNQQYPDHKYTSAGNFLVSLTLTNVEGLGFDTTVYDTLHVRNNIHYGYTNTSINPDPQCPGDEVSFNCYNAAISFFWTFGDGATSNGSNTDHTYSAAGNYIISLTITNGCGIDTTVYDTAHIANNVHFTTVGWSFNPNPVCPNDEVTYNAYSTAASYLWTFGDGVTSSQTYAYHTYTAAGDYPISLTLTNGCGIDTTVYDTVHVKSNIHYTYVGYDVSPSPICPGDFINFSTFTQSHSYLWTFGDGTTSTQLYGNHLYSNAGSYIVSLTLTNGCGIDTTVYDTIQVITNLHFNEVYWDISPNPVCPGDHVYMESNTYTQSFLWTFGDGIFSNQQYSDHIYINTGTYPVTLTLTNNCGIDTTVYNTVQVMNNLHFSGNIDIYFSPDPVCPGEDVDFGASVSADSYLWTFGDGATSTHRYASHSYTNTGNYLVSFTIINSCGNDTTVYDSIHVINNIEFENPQMYISPNPVCPGDYVYFDSYLNTDSYLWTFGDGTTSGNGHLQHIYYNPGTYPVSLTLTNGCGNDTTIYDTVLVSSNNPFNNVYWYLSPNPVCPGDKVYFHGYTSGVSYFWTFGDGGTSSQRFAEHVYMNIGTYNVSLKITNGCGYDTTVYMSVTVQNNISMNQDDYEFDTEQDIICQNDTAAFGVYPAGIGTYLIDFGDGTTSTSSTLFSYGSSSYDLFKHKYSAQGIYHVVLIIYNNCGDSIVLTTNIEVNNQAQVDPDIDWDGNLCQGQTITFYGFGGPTYLWNFGDGSAPVTDHSSFFSAVTHSYANAGTYNIILTVSNSCGDAETITYPFIVDYCLAALDEVSQLSSISIFPNPTTGSFQIVVELSGNQIANLEVFNCTGSLVYTERPDGFTGTFNRTIDLSRFADGIYFIRVTTDKFNEVKKLIKQ